MMVAAPEWSDAGNTTGGRDANHHNQFTANAAKSGKRARSQARPPKSKSIRLSGKKSGGASTTKTEKVLGLLQRTKGASISDLSSATGWQAHSVRGFLSGTVKKKMGLAVVSEKDGKGVRRYHIEAAKD